MRKSETPLTDAYATMHGVNSLYESYRELQNLCRSFERALAECEAVLRTYCDKAERMNSQAAQNGVSQMLHTNADWQAASLALAAIAALNELAKEKRICNDWRKRANQVSDQ